MPEVLLTSFASLTTTSPSLTLFLFLQKQSFIYDVHSLPFSETERRFLSAQTCYDQCVTAGYVFTTPVKKSRKVKKYQEYTGNPMMEPFKVVKLIAEYMSKKWAYVSLDTPHEVPEPPPRPIQAPKPSDILLGRGSGGTHRPGNVNYRRFAVKFLQSYCNTRKEHKRFFAMLCVANLRAQGVRFLDEALPTPRPMQMTSAGLMVRITFGGQSAADNGAKRKGQSELWVGLEGSTNRGMTYTTLVDTAVRSTEVNTDILVPNVAPGTYLRSFQFNVNSRNEVSKGVANNPVIVPVPDARGKIAIQPNLVKYYFDIGDKKAIDRVAQRFRELKKEMQTVGTPVRVQEVLPAVSWGGVESADWMELVIAAAAPVLAREREVARKNWMQVSGQATAAIDTTTTTSTSTFPGTAATLLNLKRDRSREGPTPDSKKRGSRPWAVPVPPPPPASAPPPYQPAQFSNTSFTSHEIGQAEMAARQGLLDAGLGFGAAGDNKEQELFDGLGLNVDTGMTRLKSWDKKTPSPKTASPRSSDGLRREESIGSGSVKSGDRTAFLTNCDVGAVVRQTSLLGIGIGLDRESSLIRSASLTKAVNKPATAERSDTLTQFGNFWGDTQQNSPALSGADSLDDEDGMKTFSEMFGGRAS